MTDDELLLYSRQILMPAVGIDGQQRLLDSTVLLVGAGGLGCSAAQYLLGSGIGKLLIIDNDTVELSNLPRQILFGEADIGAYKAETLCRKLNQRLPDVGEKGSHSRCTAYNVKYSAELLADIIATASVDVLVDAGDNLALSHDLDTAATRYALPLVHAAVSRFEGHCYTRLPSAEFPSLKHIFADAAEEETCSQSGVLTVAVAMIAGCQAAQVIRLLTAPALGEIQPELHLFDGKTLRFLTLPLGA